MDDTANIIIGITAAAFTALCVGFAVLNAIHWLA